MTEYQVVFLRHGESVFNKAGRFTGWIDCDLTEKGIQQAKQAGCTLRDRKLTFDVAYTSYLKRSIRTLHIVLEQMDLGWIPEFKTWRLNERHYGAMQGMLKQEAADVYGETQFKKMWRHSFDTPPPAVDDTHPQWAGHDCRYQGIAEDLLPLSGESLKDVHDRTLLYWHDTIVPAVKSGKRVLVVGHRNSLRGIIKYLENITDDDYVSLDLPNAIPFAYTFDLDMVPIKRYTIGDTS